MIDLHVITEIKEPTNKTEKSVIPMSKLRQDADTIIQCWLDDYKISDRAIAEKLGRKQRTFADQMKKIRTELRKVRDH